MKKLTTDKKRELYRSCRYEKFPIKLEQGVTTKPADFGMKCYTRERLIIFYLREKYGNQGPIINKREFFKT